MIPTERRNERSTHIDRMATGEMVALMQSENEAAVRAVEAVLPAVAETIDRAGERMRRGGRLIYVGCGTSGRLGVLDASECPPTFGVPAGRVVGILAGGEKALVQASEGTEDRFELGAADLEKAGPSEADTVVGLSVSGGAAYVQGALQAAAAAGALTVGITCNPDSPLARSAEICICPDTGAEVITGSTRMKAGTAQKVILNMISTGVMVRLGRVYENYMIYLRPTNDKLRRRMIAIVGDLAACTAEEAGAMLERNGWNIRRCMEEAEKHGKK